MAQRHFEQLSLVPGRRNQYELLYESGHPTQLHTPVSQPALRMGWCLGLLVCPCLGEKQGFAASVVQGRAVFQLLGLLLYTWV